MALVQGVHRFSKTAIGTTKCVWLPYARTSARATYALAYEDMDCCMQPKRSLSRVAGNGGMKVYVHGHKGKKCGVCKKLCVWFIQ